MGRLQLSEHIYEIFTEIEKSGVRKGEGKENWVEELEGSP